MDVFLYLHFPHLFSSLPTNGDLLTIGGQFGELFLTEIWRLSNDVWTLVGNLQNPVYMGSSIFIDKQIYVFAGPEFDSSIRMRSIQRIDISDDEKIDNVIVIGEQNGDFYYPVLYHAEKDYCVVNKM
ncbi:unnamed protein product [Oikopleura dioica]|uniref:Uncharacterized protein n=1 Tax=Oikopleura dioica TaxID=34765 RepID=E4WT98_OIKDI|nr:unnamed protein product [Oikopleura dioica]